MKNKKAWIESTVGKTILVMAFLGIFLWIIWYFLGGSIKTLLSIGEEEEKAENVFFATPYVGTYYNNKFGEITQNCTKSGNTYKCMQGTSMELYVGIINKGDKKRYFYPAPCIIKDYKKNDKCEKSDYLLSYKPCGVDGTASNPTNCVVGRPFILETGTYRVFPGAKCLPEDCYAPENPTTNEAKANYNNFFDIVVT